MALRGVLGRIWGYFPDVTLSSKGFPVIWLAITNWHDFVMKKTSAKKSLLDAYQFSGFKTSSSAKGKLSDKNARVLSLSRRSKKVSVISAENCIEVFTTAKSNKFAIYLAATAVSIWNLKFAEYFVRPRDWSGKNVLSGWLTIHFIRSGLLISLVANVEAWRSKTWPMNSGSTGTRWKS